MCASPYPKAGSKPLIFTPISPNPIKNCKKRIIWKIRQTTGKQRVFIPVHPSNLRPANLTQRVSTVTKSGDRSYTRVEYIRSKPPSRIARFTLGDTALDYEYRVTLVAPYSKEISSKALESARVTANKVIGVATGQQFLLKVVTYPHEIIRAHRFMGFAGADRLSQGMRRSFGRPTERAAMVKAGQPILAIYSMESGVETAKKALMRASKKLPLPCRVEVEALKKVPAS